MKIKTKGMMCEGCENRVRNVLKQIDGVLNVLADHKTGVIELILDKEIEFETVKEKIEDLGYTVIGRE